MSCEREHNQTRFCPQKNDFYCESCEKTHPEICKESHINVDEYAQTLVDKMSALRESMSADEEASTHATNECKESLSLRCEADMKLIHSLPDIIAPSISGIKAHREEHYKGIMESIVKMVRDYTEAKEELDGKMDDAISSIRREIDEPDKKCLIDACKEVNMRNLEKEVKALPAVQLHGTNEKDPMYEENNPCFLSRFHELFGIYTRILLYVTPLTTTINVYHPNTYKLEIIKLVISQPNSVQKDPVILPYAFASCQVGTMLYWTGGTENLLSTLSTSYAFSYNSRALVKASDLMVSRKNHSMTYLPEHKWVIALGGYNDKAGLLNSIEVYDTTIEKASWELSSIKLAKARECATICQVRNDLIYIIGGHVAGEAMPTIERISVPNRKVEAIAETFHPYTMCGAIVCPSHEDKIILFGGKELSQSFGNAKTNKVWIFDMKEQKVKEDTTSKLALPDVFPHGTSFWIEQEGEEARILGSRGDYFHGFNVRTFEWNVIKLT